MHTWRHIAATVLLAIFVVGGVLVPAVHAVHHAADADAAPTHVVVHSDDAAAEIDCTLCEAVFHPAEAASTSAPTPTLYARAWNVISPTSPRPQPVFHYVIRGPPHA
ncbi:MAG: hypothetical protein R6U20_10990 [Longimonas sp.]|uniref:hypothetical protein n=1 Tax=Longimonas sp. TaxID=2039626 RepID=UPI003976B017